jgi:DNA helicase IV
MAWELRRKKRRDSARTFRHQIIELVSIRKYIKSSLDKNRYNETFTRFQKFSLTEDQVDAAVSHYKETLVVASAGSGKTSLLLGRSKYLLESGRAQPNQILALAFNARAAEELGERARALHLDVQSKTFHSFGNSLLNLENRRGGVAFADANSLESFIQERLTEINSDAGSTEMLSQYFSAHMVPFRPFEQYKDLSEYSASLKGSLPVTLSGTYVKSHGEWLIANFLHREGIDFEYEEVFRPPGKSNWTHKPDFTVHQPGRKPIYIEYFGTDSNGNTAPWIDREKYHSQTEWKRTVHSTVGTQLIELTYGDLQNGILLTRLDQALHDHGIARSPLSDAQVLEKANEVGYTSQFARLCSSFLSHARAQRMTAESLRSRDFKDARTNAFMAVFSEILSSYEAELRRLGLPDFSDMIHEAADLLEQGVVPFPYTHVLVDEYQDIAVDRNRLLQAMRIAQPDLEILLVGDDWQAINRFAGSDISIMRHLSKPKRDRRMVTLARSHRFSQPLANASSQFIAKNPDQLRKTVESGDPGEDSDPLVIHWDVEIDQLVENLKIVIERIGDGNSEESELLVVARYNSNLPSFEQVSALWKGPIEIRTVHSSKGMEADYVIVTDVQQDWRGFPSIIQDDPILNLVLPEEERYPFAEERRIFYVALTRARKATHVVSPQSHPSVFALELENEGLGKHIGRDSALNSKCPICDSGTIVRGRNTEACFCSNSPHCKISMPKCGRCNRVASLISVHPLVYRCPEHPTASWKKCPACDFGVLVKRTGKYGPFTTCHMWPQTGCKGKISK